jgi:cryptochrome
MIWREFYYACSANTENYDKMIGNPICRQIPWGDRDDPVYIERLEAWKTARTGFPFIDAIMTQLRQEGHIHHLARHMVACFLTRGDLWVHWEEGLKVFDQLLIDADWALNVGNWMWLSCSCFFYQYFRCYSPVAFGKKYDPDGCYIKHYLPALKNLPKKYIYEPWKAPLDVQRKAGVIIGVDYPQPIVDHAVVSKQNMTKLSDAYAAHKGQAASGTGVTKAAGSKPSQKRKRPSSDKGTDKGARSKLKQTTLV